jgi:ribonuclease J
LETKLEAQGAHIHRDVHVSGHAGRADTEEFVRLINPKHIIPCHGTPERLRTMAGLAHRLGYPSERIHVFGNGISLKIGD